MVTIAVQKCLYLYFEKMYYVNWKLCRFNQSIEKAKAGYKVPSDE